MSLWSLLREPDVRERFKTEFATPAFGIKQELIAPSIIPTHAALIGTAFDYLLRFYTEHLNAMPSTQSWVAEDALTLKDIKQDTKTYKKGQTIIKEARKHYTAFLTTGNINEQLIQSVILLAQLDVFYRAGYERGIANFGIVEQGDIKDIQNLFRIIPSATFKANRMSLSNPTFGEASRLVGGADADIIIDEILIDIKTVKELKLQREYLNQLVGYYSLNILHQQMDSDPETATLQRFGLYFSRYGYLHTIEIKNIINQKTYPTFLQWFKKRAAHHGATGE